MRMGGSIVIWGGPPYFGHADSVQAEMARAFRALGNDVLYLELEGDGAPFRGESRMCPGPVAGTAVSSEGIIVARIAKVPLAPFAMVNSILSVNMGMAVRQLRWLEPIWQDSRPMLVVYGWFASALAQAFPGARLVYDCIDEHRAADGVEGNASRIEHVWEHEQRLMNSAVLTVCVSAPLAEDRRAAAARLIVLPNASDTSWCRDSFAEPSGIADLPHPRALFLGRIGPKVDLELVRAAAAADGAIAWVLAGEVVGPGADAMPPNVRVLGRVHHDDLAPVAAHCDCGVAPLRPTAWNRASSPLKFGEYAAAGLPVVSSPIPAAEMLRETLGDAVVTAEGADAFLAAVRSAVARPADVRSRLRAYAAEHTWERRARAALAGLDGAGGSR
jgi:teichuronic acid biosynthesis glycosyltransferase TuaH